MSLRDVVMLWYLKCTLIGGVRREIRKKKSSFHRVSIRAYARNRKTDTWDMCLPRAEALTTTRVNSMVEASSLEGFRG